MPALLKQDKLAGLPLEVDERDARKQLRRQISRLEAELADLFATAFGHTEIPHRVAALTAAPRVLDLGELEAVRDSLANRVAEARAAVEERERVEESNHELVQKMLAAPQDYKWVRVSREDLGLHGCGHWHSKPRLGPIGMLMGWWRVKISSGCPLAGRLTAVERQIEAGEEEAAGKEGHRTRRATPGALGERASCRAGHPRRDRRPCDRLDRGQSDGDRHRHRPCRSRRAGGGGP